MKKAIRSYLFLPLAAILLVAIPALLFSMTGKTAAVLAQTIPSPTATGTIPPVITATPTTTIPGSPLPTPVPTRRPVSPLPAPAPELQGDAAPRSAPVLTSDAAPDAAGLVEVLPRHRGGVHPVGIAARLRGARGHRGDVGTQ